MHACALIHGVRVCTATRMHLQKEDEGNIGERVAHVEANVVGARILKVNQCNARHLLRVRHDVVDV